MRAYSTDLHDRVVVACDAYGPVPHGHWKVVTL